MTQQQEKPKVYTAMMSLAELVGMEHPQNPKEHDLPALVDSFVRFGFVTPPMIDERSHVLVAGHGRCEALALMKRDGWVDAEGQRQTSAPPGIVVGDDGEWHVPVLRGHSFSDDRSRDAYIIADNQHTIHGGWNIERLSSMMSELRIPDAADFGLGGMGFDEAELESLWSFGGGGDADGPAVRQLPKEKPEQKTLAQDDIPEPPKVPITRRGNVWQLGEHVLICADCTELDASRLRIGKVGFALTSPPYNAGRNVERFVHGKAGGDSRYQDSDDSMDADEYAELLRASTMLALESCNVVAINLQSLAQNKRVIARWAARFADHLVDRAVWVKSSTQPAINKNVFNSQFEDVYIFANARRPKRTIETAQFHGTISNVHEGASAARDNDYADVHGATMPVHLAQWAIEKLGARADYVVDPFGGTGTTLVVAQQLGKRAALVELDPAYCDVVIERWEKLTGGKATRD